MSLELSKIWKEFAPGPAELILKKNLEPSDAGLILRLEEKVKQFSQNPKLISLLTPPENMNEIRAVQWAESRRSLLAILDKFKGDFKLSISHCQSHSVVLACQGDNLSGVGVDIENARREVTKGAALKFYSPEEANLNLSPLEVWVVKEACYKADTSRRGTVVTQYQVVSFDPKSSEGEVALRSNGIPFLDFKIFKTEDVVVAMVLNFQS
jgi:phosphopantetheinyl transferase (holo-ACP synthase)